MKNFSQKKPSQREEVRGIKENIKSTTPQSTDEEIKQQAKELLRKQMELLSERSEEANINSLVSLSEAMAKVGYELAFYL